MDEHPYSPADYARLGEAVHRRRRDMDMNQADVQEAGGPSISMLSKIENGTLRPGRRVVIALENVLLWDHGSVEQILQGGQPTLTVLRPVTGSGPDSSVTDYPDFVGGDPFYQHIWNFEGVPEDEREYAILRVELRRMEKEKRLLRQAPQHRAARASGQYPSGR
ncbi:helix-turn-helix domain-containing protein [Actinomadura harenae]|uniref:XRE family transcriptional regulator n=1 Tax=Actinomadura harenae TaxID=2483351 RepID=A0A3M2LR83_9ACTN|nr:helix-turn-helix transcriptional regulator [Actinomadura harenae]RMI39907.1 XRE family transcriptional regulator [Actinomadura harenae]